MPTLPVTVAKTLGDDEVKALPNRLDVAPTEEPFRRGVPEHDLPVRVGNQHRVGEAAHHFRQNLVIHRRPALPSLRGASPADNPRTAKKQAGPSGRSGIRTHGGPKTSTAFEAVPFVRSGILPGRTLVGGSCDNPADGRPRGSVHADEPTITGPAWQQWGSGPDVFVVPPLISNCELIWEQELYRRGLEYQGEHVRVTAFDKRGIGLSDRFDSAPTLEQRCEDILTVMDATRLEHATLIGFSEGGLMSQLVHGAASRRVERLVLGNSAPGLSASVELDPDLDTTLAKFGRLIEEWGTNPQWFVESFNPSQKDNAAFVRWCGRFQRIERDFSGHRAPSRELRPARCTRSAR